VRRLQSSLPAFLLAVSCAVLTTGCHSAGEEQRPPEESEARQGQTGFACDIDNASGRDFQLSGLEDPFAQLILREGEGCPKSFAAIVEKLEAADEACGGTNQTRVISESAANTGKPGPFRAVTSRSCGDRKRWELVFSFGTSVDAPLASNVEVAAFDRASGVFNYYDMVGGGIAFFGNSKDFIDLGPGNGETRKCARCHTGGGLIMKELDSPWLHWDTDNHLSLAGREELFATPAPSLPAAHALRTKKRVLGEFADGANMQGLVEEGNREWNKHRIVHLKNTGDVTRLLEPLFCETEVNLGSGVGDDVTELVRVPNDALSDFGGSSVRVNDGQYRTLIKETRGQRVASAIGFESGALEVKDLTRDNGQVVGDVAFDFTFIERSAADRNFVDNLTDGFSIEGNEFPALVTKEFADDVLRMDLTRQVFSKKRCGLLSEFAPTLSPDEITPENILGGFKANLEARAETAFEKQFLKFISTSEDSGRDASDAFIAACKERDKDDFLADVMKIVAINRAKARNQFTLYREIPGTMPIDDDEITLLDRLAKGLDDTLHFDAADCTLVRE